MRVLRKQQTTYAAALSVPCGSLFRAWRPTHFLNEPFAALSQLLRHCKRYCPWGRRLKHPAWGRVVQWISATSSAFFTVSHQNGFSSSIQSASNLSLVRIRYLYADSIYRALCTKFPRSEGLGSGARAKTLVGHLQLSLYTTTPKKIALFFGGVDFIEDFWLPNSVALCCQRKHT